MGRRIGPYEVAGFIGVGGMGMVYRAADKRLGRNVALRFLPKDLNGDGAALERFRVEARDASKLNHPNICTIYDIGDDGGSPYLVMELLEGQYRCLALCSMLLDQKFLQDARFPNKAQVSFRAPRSQE